MNVAFAQAAGRFLRLSRRPQCNRLAEAAGARAQRIRVSQRFIFFASVRCKQFVFAQGLLVADIVKEVDAELANAPVMQKSDQFIVFFFVLYNLRSSKLH